MPMIKLTSKEGVTSYANSDHIIAITPSKYLEGRGDDQVWKAGSLVVASNGTSEIFREDPGIIAGLCNHED